MKYTYFSLIALLFFSCSPNGPEIFKNQNAGSALGTSYSLTYLSDKQLDLQKEIDSVFDTVNRSLSTYIPNSDISKINRGDSTLVVDAMFRDVFELSKEIYEKTEGYFDPTVGVLVDAWGFGPGEQMELDSVRIDSLLNFVGFDKVTLTDENTIVKSNPDIHLDFNAIAKGYTIDRLARLMDQKNIQDYLLEVGGEVVAKGLNKIKEKQWVVGIDDPQMGDTRKLKILINLKDRALASSGNYRKFRTDPITGKKYVHTIDPKTGFTKNANTLGVTTLANTCAKADAYATAFMAMDLDEAIKLLTSQRELEAYIVYLDEKGEPQEFMTEGFKQLITE
ncbi:thiamine biosynthesis lipoprotein [Pricia antarctica]|uniref:FAD:protein FMN transferase n=1 Tax=Pricia antarctica TaxID=641691 RepID=A0A1G6ZRN6_9FLAO|nr:FAD:protein FMN transferase [Pricia antarctica]SDE05181.1 thiamine biosynthesis lipoprotein [Pricia antarctica]